MIVSIPLSLSNVYFKSIVFMALLTTLVSHVSASVHPSLVVTANDVINMRHAIGVEGQFKQAFLAKKQHVDRQISLAFDVPVPKDAGGGYTHERHKLNYNLMYDAGIIYQLTQNEQYAYFVRDMLLSYAQLYPTLPLHPKRKSNNVGKLFWQGLNEAVWLVHTIQAYDFIYPALSKRDIEKIEKGIIRPVALFLSEESPHTFNKVHNHGTWATAAVGMTGYVLGDLDWVEKALLGLDKLGHGGFLRQLDELFSPQGYYTEGPYYQRYALMPFITFAKAIHVNEPFRNIFKYRDGVLLKAIDSTIQLSFNQLFYPINDAIKDKGIDTIELVNGVALAYALTGNQQLLDIAHQQNNILLTGDGLKVAQALDRNLAQAYQFKSIAFGDGKSGDDGALVIMRAKSPKEQSILFKATAQGLGHGHFDKLTWQFYHNGKEIVSDYGAARFLNVEAKYGGRYLPENKSWAKQSVAHNTLVINENSHFGGETEEGNKHHPSLNYFVDDSHKEEHSVVIASASIDTAYKDAQFTRTIASIVIGGKQPLVLDVLEVQASNDSQFDLPIHYQGQLIRSNVEKIAYTNTMKALGDKNGYQHLWLRAKGKTSNDIIQVTWLNDNGTFYTHSGLNSANTELLFTQLGANDPDFNLRNEHSFITRVKGQNRHTFVSILEPHGEYNPSKEFTLASNSRLKKLSHEKQGEIDVVQFSLADDEHYLLAFNSQNTQQKKFTHSGEIYSLDNHYKIIKVTQK